MKIENLCINCMREKASAEGTCEHCGFDPATASIPPHHLAPFVILAGKYLVGKAIGEGGFGITYIGMDLNLEMRVAIKEYYPNGCAIRDTRGNTSTVQSYSGEAQEFFEAGREKFINEAKILAKCINLPEIVTVKDFFKENHTAYIVMEYLDGKTLKDYLKEKGGRISVSETLSMMEPLIKSLGKVHKMNLIHRDISPDNIMITSNGSVKVLDFGGARDFVSSGGKSMSIMLKPGYAPEEQYRTHGEQGPWTDVYALCATMYRCITGQIPPESMERTYQDKMKPVSVFVNDCPSELVYAINKGLSVYKDNRFQSMEELYNSLYHGVVPPEPEPWEPISGNNRNGNSGNPVEDRPDDPPNDPANDDGGLLNNVLKIMAGVLGGILLLLLAVFAVRFVFLAKEDVSLFGGNRNNEEEIKPESTPTPEIESTPTPTPEIESTPTPTIVPIVAKIDMTHIQNTLFGGRVSNSNQSLYIYDCLQEAGRGTDNSSEAMAASALITIPILYTTAVRIETGSLSLDTQVAFEYTYEGGRGTLTSAQNGQAVPLRTLLQNMLMYSDNNAINSMINVLSLDVINQTCHEAGFDSVDMQRKIIRDSSPLNNYQSAKDTAMMVKDLYNNKFSVINRDFLLSYMRISDRLGRLGIFQSDVLYNGGNYCSQNGIVPDTTEGRYTEVGIILADGKEYILCTMADSGNADVAASEFSDAAQYIHRCMKEG